MAARAEKKNRWRRAGGCAARMERIGRKRCKKKQPANGTPGPTELRAARERKKKTGPLTGMEESERACGVGEGRGPKRRLVSVTVRCHFHSDATGRRPSRLPIQTTDMGHRATAYGATAMLLGFLSGTPKARLTDPLLA